MPITLKHPSFFRSCLNAYFAKTTTVAPGANVYAVPFASDGVKKVGVAEQRESKTIYASGKVFMINSAHSLTNLGIDAILLDPEFKRWALGHLSDTNGGLSAHKSTDQPIEFAFGCVFEYANGMLVFRWYPRCILSNGDETIATSEAAAVDPTNAYTVVAMPYGTGDAIAIEYDQSLVLSTKNPLTEDVFFATVATSETDIRFGTETAKV